MGGDVGLELSYGVSDLLLQSSLLSSFQSSQIDSGTTGLTAFGAGTITVADGGDYKEGHLVELRNEAGDLEGRGVYEVTGIAANVLTVTPHTSDTNAVTASFAAQDAAPASDQEATELQVIGYRADANGEIALTVAGGVATLTATTGSNFDNLLGGGASGDLLPGHKIKLSGFPLATSNVYARVISVDETADTITFSQPTGMVADPAAGQRPIIWFGDRAVNGTESIESHYYAIERTFGDLSPVGRELFLGGALNQLSVQLQPQSIATATASFFGLDSQVSTGENSGTGQGILYNSGLVLNRLSSAANDVYNTSSNVGRIGRGVDPVAQAGINFVLGATIDINNNLRRQLAVGVLGAAGIGVGEFGVSGSLDTYFDSFDLLTAVINNDDTSLDVTLRGSDGRAIDFDMPRIKFSGGAPNVPGKNQDTVINLTYEAIRDVTLGYTMAITRFPYVE